MKTAPYARNGLALGLLAGAGALAGAGLLIWRAWRGRQPQDAPAAAFAGTGAHKDSPVQVRDAGPEHIRDEDGEDWDALDQASDESFPTSDPPTANDFRTPEPIDYSDGKASRPH
ncbi:hypothetical protein [Sphingobium nicotianae]|uniref:hypothetical protein n=1 Tax=Sphingobium nicotianae TaxID=2782607 RepID=UPI00203227B5|nr:hypothetical protein [Sphingobium nicotianae]